MILTISNTLSGLNFVIDLGIPFKLALATGIGMIIGRERKKQDKSGGARTMAMIALGACLLAILTLEINTKLNPNIFDFTRLMTGGMGGMGFIGAGIIWKHRGEIEGLTTAATLLALMPIGYCIGLGFYPIGIISAIFVYLILESKYKKIRRRKKNV